MSKTIDIGAVAEHKFAAELLHRGIMPSWPSSQLIPYDLVAELPNRLVRIQVKGTRRIGKSIEVDVRKYSTSKTRSRYTKHDTDFIVVYIFETNDWYLLPIKNFNSTTLTLKPGDPRCKWLKYKNAWELLK